MSTPSCSSASTRRALERTFIPSGESAASPLSAIEMDLYEAATDASAVVKMANNNFMVAINKSNDVIALMLMMSCLSECRRSSSSSLI
jgi:hypothetical protein